MPAFPYLFYNTFFPINITTIAMMLLAGLIVVVVMRIAARNLDMRRPGRLQNFFEWAIEFAAGTARDTMPSERIVRSILPLAFTMLIFLFVSNWLGVVATISIKTSTPVPWLGLTAARLAQAHGVVPLFDSPTANMSMTLGLAFMVWLLSHAQGLKTPGRYFRHFVRNPMAIIEEITNPLTHGMRLYGNIFAGEALIGVLVGAPLMYLPLTVPLLLVWLFYSAFVSTIQAYVFTILMTLYVGHKAYSESLSHH